MDDRTDYLAEVLRGATTVEQKRERLEQILEQEQNRRLGLKLRRMRLSLRTCDSRSCLILLLAKWPGNEPTPALCTSAGSKLN